MIISLIIKLIRSLLTSAVKNPKKAAKVVVGAAAGIGAASTCVGIGAAAKAKRTNKRAIAIQTEALQLHDAEYTKTQNVLELLGKAEKNVIESFTTFADTIEKIQNRPQMKTNVFSSIKIPNYEPQELKRLSTEFRIAVAGMGGAGIGAAVGLAAFGLNTLIVAPATLAFGGVICVKGFSMHKKAVENVRQAKKMKESVDEM